MRSVAVGIVLLAGCGAKYKPVDPALSGYEHAVKFPIDRPFEGLVYNGLVPATPAPMIPMLAFGAAFDVDVVLMPSEGDFQMLEFARIALPTGPQWIALETSAQGGDQTMLANLDDFAKFMPEIPISRQTSNLQVTDRSSEFTLDVSLEYTNSRGQAVTATLMGDPPTKATKRRNGKTFDHSANQLMAVLDIPASQSLFKADVQIEGNGLGMKKIAAIVPARFVLEQAQGGIVTGAFKVIPGAAAGGGAELSSVVVNSAGTESTVKASPEMMLRSGVALNASGIRTCWTDRAAEKADLKGGEITWKFTVTGGKVTNAAPVPGTPAADGTPAFTDEALVTCVNNAINGWTLDPTVTGEVTWPFGFVPADGDDEVSEPVLSLGMGSLVVPEGAAPVAPGAVDPLDGLAEGSPAPEEEAAAAPLSSFTSIHTVADGSTVELQWNVTRLGDRVVAKQATPERTLTYNYRLVQNNYLELVTITVEQYGRATPVTGITFNPPLPDLRWPFNGKRISNYTIDVNGQRDHAYGEAEAFWTETGPKVRISGTEPEWVANRPMLTSISYAPDGSAQVTLERVGE
jgi:hypothetical protein